ncbi:protein lifeguard 2-like [Photinus pyralis]|uniref:protein lifeguard 2-like n=1 Tax=Photinus pyralis TaxID=7054 RepID=UPI0012672854|nr:protein lifeguard 2-like [Photinus pyralis]
MNEAGDTLVSNDVSKPRDACVVLNIEENPSVECRKEPFHLPSKEKLRTQQGNRYGNPYNQGAGFGQTPYYQQQLVGGQPVYVQVPGAQNVATAGYRYRFQDGGEQGGFTRDEHVFMRSFDNQVIRSRFIQRVYTILAVQLLYTFAVVFLCMFVPEVNEYVRSTSFLVIIAGVVYLVVYLILICVKSARRQYPLNFVLLAIFTISFSYCVAYMSVFYKTHIVLMSIGMTAVITLVVSVLACQTSFDFTDCAPLLCFITLVSLVCGSVLLLIAALTHTPVLYAVYSAIIGFLFVMYLAYDTQLIMGGRHVELSPEEYIHGALTLYIDIIEILIHVMQILDRCS